MEVALKSRNGLMTFKLSGATMKEVFREIAHTQEVFDEADHCGKCGGTNIRFRHRIAEAKSGKQNYDYYELVCQSIDSETGRECRAKLQFGQHLEGGTLFVKRKNENDEWLPDGGWVRYVKPGTKDGDDIPF